MNHRSSHQHVFERRHRLGALGVVAAVVVGAPLVARALGDDSPDDSITAASVLAASDAPPRAAGTDVPSTDSGASPEPEAPTAAAAPVVVAQAPPADSPTGEVTIEPVVEQAPPIDVHAVLTDAYIWDERTLRVAALQDVLNLPVDGWYSPATRAAHVELLEFLGLGTDGVPPVPPPGPSPEQWAALRQCESGGDYTIVSSSGRYRGAYQFAVSTWDSVAARNNPALVGVDPANATPAQQDTMAYALYLEAGAGPWPVCGRNL